MSAAEKWEAEERRSRERDAVDNAFTQLIIKLAMLQRMVLTFPHPLNVTDSQDPHGGSSTT